MRSPARRREFAPAAARRTGCRDRPASQACRAERRTPPARESPRSARAPRPPARLSAAVVSSAAWMRPSRRFHGRGVVSPAQLLNSLHDQFSDLACRLLVALAALIRRQIDRGAIAHADIVAHEERRERVITILR